MNIYICDGVEMAGKSSIIERIRRKYPKMEFCHFPSDELIKKHYKSVTGKTGQEQHLIFLKELIVEEKDFIARNKNKNLIIDRMWVSALIYQGDGEYVNNKDGEFNQTINNLFIKTFKELDINLKNVFHFVFLKSFDDIKLEREISTEDKNENDKNNKTFKMKLRNLVTSRKESLLFDCLENFIVFDEKDDDKRFISKKQTIERVDEIQNNRFEIICKIIDKSLIYEKKQKKDRKS